MKSLVAIVGPTGIGKSRLAIRLARKFDGEIVSADSRQVYRHMDIGTAKPDSQNREHIRHHLIDIIDPSQDFSLAQYQALAFDAIRDIQGRDKLPVLVGGSGLYVWAVLEGWHLPEAKPDPELRRYLEKKAADVGHQSLYEELMKINPVAAQKIDPRNVRRVIRALEVHHQTDTAFSQLQDKKTPPFRSLIIGLTAERKELYRQIDKRVDDMMEQGLVGEVEKLVNMVALGFINKLAGLGFGILKAAVVISIVLLIINHFDDKLISKEKKQNSFLYAPISAIAPLLWQSLKELNNDKIKEFKEDPKKVTV